MAEKQLNTIIQLRNDSTDNWSNATVSLKKGEAAVEITANGKAKVKIGTEDNQSFANAPYIGGEEAQLFTNTTPLASTNTQDDALEVIPTLIPKGTELHDGDVAVVKRYISEKTDAGAPISYTSYVYDNGNWVACDGNYSASNVFLKNNITLAGDFTSVGNYKKGTTTINAGTSLESLLSGMLQQELYPGVDGKVDTPSVTISVSGGNGEVGTTFSAPTATLKVTDVGSYPYAPTATGITFAVGDVVLAEAANADAVADAANKTSNNSIMKKDSTITLTATNSGTYTDAAQSYKFSGTAKHSDGVVPKTNLGNDYPDAQIESTTLKPTTATATFSGWRYIFGGGTTATTIDSAAIRALGTKVFKSNQNVQTSFSETAGVFTAAEGATKVVFAYPSDYTSKTPKFEMFGLSWGEFTGFEEMETTVSVEGANGATSKAYKVFVYTPAGPLEATSTKFRVRFA